MGSEEPVGAAAVFRQSIRDWEAATKSKQLKKDIKALMSELAAEQAVMNKSRL